LLDFELAQRVCAAFIRGNNHIALTEKLALRLGIHFTFKKPRVFRIAPKSKVDVYSIRAVSPIVDVGFSDHPGRKFVGRKWMDQGRYG
jgi:hypothetical protein